MLAPMADATGILEAWELLRTRYYQTAGGEFRVEVWKPDNESTLVLRVFHSVDNGGSFRLRTSGRPRSEEEAIQTAEAAITKAQPPLRS